MRCAHNLGAAQDCNTLFFGPKQHIQDLWLIISHQTQHIQMLEHKLHMLGLDIELPQRTPEDISATGISQGCMLCSTQHMSAAVSIFVIALLQALESLAMSRHAFDCCWSSACKMRMSVHAKPYLPHAAVEVPAHSKWQTLGGRVVGSVLGHEAQVTQPLQQQLQRQYIDLIFQANQADEPANIILLFHRKQSRLPQDEIQSLLAKASAQGMPELSELSAMGCPMCLLCISWAQSAIHQQTPALQCFVTCNNNVLAL